jgi:hypothetical protein
VSIKQTLRTSVAAGALLALVAPVAFSSSASAGKADVTFGGHINKGLLYADDGVNNGVFIVDNWMSGSRVNVKASGQLTEAVSVAAGATFRFAGARDARFDAVTGDKSISQTTGSVWTDSVNIGFSHKSMGSLAIGNGSLAGGGALEQNYLGGAWAQGWGFNGPTNKFAFVNSTTNVASTILQSSFDDYDPYSPDRVRYDTPSFNGTKLSTSIDQNGNTNFGINYGGDFGGVSVIAGAFYENNHASTKEDTLNSSQWGGSIGVLHSSGLNATLIYGVEKTDKSSVAASTDIGSSKRTGGGVGYNTNLSSLGETGLFVTYNQIKDSQSKGDKYTNYQVGVGQSIDSIGMEFALEYIRSKYTDLSTQYNDIDMVYFATRLPF